MTQDLDALIDRADLDGLIRAVDAMCLHRNWNDVLRTRDLCRSATRTGRQVWPIATLCEYRLALHAPAQLACRVIEDEASRFSIGPLTEVVAQSHPWSDLRDHLTSGPHRDIVAYERVLRGDTIDAAETNPSTLDLPFRICSWEPEYSLALYSDDGVHASCPVDTWTHEWEDVSARIDGAVAIDDDETESALRSLVEPWTSSSTGVARCVVVEGGLDSLAAEMDRRTLRIAAVTSHQALDWLAWCGASSGAHGRRRGAAAGRFNAGWLLCAVAGLDWDESNATGSLASELGQRLEALDWYRIESEHRHSYELSLAAVDKDENMTFGLFAHDDSN